MPTRIAKGSWSGSTSSVCFGVGLRLSSSFGAAVLRTAAQAFHADKGRRSSRPPEVGASRPCVLANRTVRDTHPDTQTPRCPFTRVWPTGGEVP